MSPEQIRLLRATSHVLLGIGPEAFETFYRELFRLAPEARALFPADLGTQRLKLLNMIAILIGALEQTDRFTGTARHLGERHNRYGDMSGFYAPAKVALMACLTEALGSDFTPDVRDAWGTLYDRVESEMQQAH
ncbi:globin domain-containing protein [Methylobacterium trifolii]|uniref:Bacterial hemoglobin n=1 Tax=Methylobacterium trifolii TaxID=1003092 RepID=A0ABQ4U1S3_9HYPH|nr:globin domain-containing protein [Methylobacterium trifolii]GJE61420.1 Bacterial hemoglobin [Methylobacterium trifolii]